jgi:hypothetical protein
MAAFVATVVDTKALGQTVAASFAAGVGVAVVFSCAIYGAARFGEMGREGRTAAALAYGAIGVVAALAFLAAIVAGIIVMTQK